MDWIDDGRGQVNAVRTTGIYCRAGCAGRPLAKNVDRLASPAAAEAAGFRPCLRCRSDELPVVTVAEGVDPTIERALIMVSEGYLDGSGERDLAAAVGLSARHLRRLFTDLVGATPSQVARSRRSHFARRLLDDTDLSITDITYAAGFGSQRRMNDAMLKTFGFSPSRLRARRGQREASAVDGGLRLRLSATRPLEFEWVLEALRAQLIEGVEAIEGQTYRRSTTICGSPGVVEISTDSTDRELLVTMHLPALSGLIDEVARCRRVVRLDFATPGPPGDWNSFEAAVRCLFEDGDHRAELAGLAELVTLCGSPIPGVGHFGLTHAFPSPIQMAAGLVGHQEIGRELTSELQELAAAFGSPTIASGTGGP